MLSIHRTVFFPLKINKNHRRDPFDSQGALSAFYCDSGSEWVKKIGGHSWFERRQTLVRNNKSCLCFDASLVGTIKVVVVLERNKLLLFWNNKSYLDFFFTFWATSVAASRAVHGSDGATNVEHVLHLDTCTAAAADAFCWLTG